MPTGARTAFPFGWLVLTLVALVAVLLAGDLVVEAGRAARELPGSPTRGPGWWLGIVAPPLLVPLLSGTRLRSWRHVVAFAWAASAATVVVDYVRVTSGAGPPHPAASAPLFFWVFGLLVRWIAFGLLFSAGAAIGALARRRGS